jgi:hypothetical protein
VRRGTKTKPRSHRNVIPVSKPSHDSAKQCVHQSTWFTRSLSNEYGLSLLGDEGAGEAAFSWKRLFLSRLTV